MLLDNMARPEDEDPHIVRCRSWQQQQADKNVVDRVTPDQENLFVHIFNLNSDGTARGRPPSAKEIKASQRLMANGWSIGEGAHLTIMAYCVCAVCSVCVCVACAPSSM